MGGPGSGRKRVVVEARCLKHADSYVFARDSSKSAAGRRRQYVCIPVIGERHTFSVLATSPGLPLEEGDTVRAVVTSRFLLPPPPPCPLHAGSYVVRNGRYGQALPKRRQRYKCRPVDHSKPHSFTPPLPRDHVHIGEEHCEYCDELRGVHRGETAVARRHSWSTRIVARSLEQLANGATYAEVRMGVWTSGPTWC